MSAEEELAPPDTLLVRRVLRRDPEAIETLVQRMKFVPRMLSALNVRLGRPLDEHELLDLGQEVLILIWKKLPRFDGKTSLESWGFRVCYFCILNAARRARHRSVVGLGLEADALTGESRTDPGEFEAVYRGLERLAPGDSQILRLKHFEDLTFEEIGARLSIPTNTAKTRYYRALCHMQEHLSAQEVGVR
jgi:RNA polymerase sigma factor (sigma-70 family)